jgi:hypothetical protein
MLLLFKLGFESLSLACPEDIFLGVVEPQTYNISAKGTFFQSVTHQL